MQRLQYLFNLVVALFLVLIVAVNRDKQVFGEPLKELFGGGKAKVELLSRNAQGYEVVNTAALEEKIFGYGGRTPLLITLTDGRIESVVIGKNSESPDFLDAVVKGGLFERWNGLTLDEAAHHRVDVVSGATLTSESVIRNVEVAAAQLSGAERGGGLGIDLTWRLVIALLVIAFGVVVNLRKIHNKWVKIALFALNVGVLGFWCGSFLSLSLFISWAANGVNLAVSLVTCVLFVVAIVMPLVGRKGSYCAFHCPMGAAQELVSLSNKAKVRIPAPVAKVLNNLRNVILAVMMIMMWTGVGFSVVDYEVFSAFMVSSASTAVLVIALLSLFLSIFVHRPYCRFVCPTGALLTLTQRTNNQTK